MRRICMLSILALVLMAPGWAATTYLKVENLAKTTLSAELTGGALSISVADGSVFPASGQFVVVVYTTTMDAGFEVILCDSVSGNTITVNASGRGQEGTADSTWASGSYVVQTWTKGQIEDIWEAINNIETGTTELDGVTLGDDDLVSFGAGGDYTLGFDGSTLDLIDADDNVHLEVNDGGGTGTLRVNATISAGANDSTQGTLRAYGATGGQGGRLQLDNDATNDSTINIWYLVPVAGDLEFRRDSTPYMTVDDATGDITFANDLVQGASSRNKMRSFWVPVSEMNGDAAAGTVTVGDFTVVCRDFDDSTDESLSFVFCLPDYSGDDLEAVLVWGATAAATKVNWVVYMYSAVDQTTPTKTTGHDAIDTAPGNNMVARHPVTVTPDSAADGDTILFCAIERDADDATNDTYVGDASLIGLLIHY